MYKYMQFFNLKQHGVATTLTDTPVAFTLKNIIAFTLKIVLYLLWKSS